MVLFYFCFFACVFLEALYKRYRQNNNSVSSPCPVTCTCEHVILLAKETLPKQIQMSRMFLEVLIQTSTIRSRKPFPTGSERYSYRQIWCEKASAYHCWLWRWRQVPWFLECRGSLERKIEKQVSVLRGLCLLGFMSDLWPM